MVEVSFVVVCQPAFSARLPAGAQLAFVRNGAIHLVNSDGTGVIKLTDGPDDCEPAWSPDGSWIAFVRRCNTTAASSSPRSLQVMKADGSGLTTLMSMTTVQSPSWSPDGNRIAFSALRNGQGVIVTVSAIEDGTPPSILVDRQGANFQPSWSPDGKQIAFISDWVAFDFVYDIYVVDVATGAITQLTNGFNYWANLVQYFEPTWSPDGSRLAVSRCPAAFYTCDASELVVMHADGSGSLPVAAVRGSVSPSWAPDGMTIAFSSRGNIGWVRPSTGERGFIVESGYSPVWRPQ